jgi:hypothetical protein
MVSPSCFSRVSICACNRLRLEARSIRWMETGVSAALVGPY